MIWLGFPQAGLPALRWKRLRLNSQIFPEPRADALPAQPTLHREVEVQHASTAFNYPHKADDLPLEPRRLKNLFALTRTRVALPPDLERIVGGLEVVAQWQERVCVGSAEVAKLEFGRLAHAVVGWLFLRSSAAPMKALNGGLGRIGRDLNSGWACSPKKNG